MPLTQKPGCPSKYISLLLFFLVLACGILTSFITKSHSLFNFYYSYFLNFGQKHVPWILYNYLRKFIHCINIYWVLVLLGTKNTMTKRAWLCRWRGNGESVVKTITNFWVRNLGCAISWNREDSRMIMIQLFVYIKFALGKIMQLLFSLTLHL